MRNQLSADDAASTGHPTSAGTSEDPATRGSLLEGRQSKCPGLGLGNRHAVGFEIDAVRVGSASNAGIQCIDRLQLGSR